MRLPCLLIFAVLVSDKPPQTPTLTLRVRPGDTLATIFSRAISVKVDGYVEYVRRVSGTGSYVVLDTAGGNVKLNLSYRYDGRPEGRLVEELRQGGRVSCDTAGTCTPRTDGSGLSYNPRLWGDPPARLRDGMSWTVQIPEAWELGPPGTERVTVIHIDSAWNAITLEREGQGDGAFDGDLTQITLVSSDSAKVPVTLAPGRSHWIGYTTFRDGRVLSDELLVERPVALTSQSAGRLSGVERQYILLNARPAS